MVFSPRICNLYLIRINRSIQVNCKTQSFWEFLNSLRVNCKTQIFGGFVIGLRLAFISIRLASLSFKTPRAKSTLVAKLGLLSYIVGI